jgi:hypothetical protein
MTAFPKDPAEQSGYLRYFYRDWRPTRLGRFWSSTIAWLSAMGRRRSVFNLVPDAGQRAPQLDRQRGAVISDV